MEYRLKLLDENMQACNGGRKQYQLNKTYTQTRTPQMCNRGFHTTLALNVWRGSRVFVAEIPHIYEEEKDKAVSNKIKLVLELTPQMLAEYEKVAGTAWAEYEKVTGTAWAEYMKVKETASAEYLKVKEPAWAEYLKVKETAWAEYEKVKETASAEYNQHLSDWLCRLVKANSLHSTVRSQD